MPLNPTLYGLLRQEFGNVRLAHKDDAMAKQYVINYDVHPPRLKLAPPAHGYGEYYRVNCPFCYDTRGRLWINHMWGVWDSVVSSYNLWLANCFNEEACLSDPDCRQALFKQVYGFKNMDQRSDPIEILTGNTYDEPLKEVTYPGDWIALTNLGQDHPAIQYMLSREYTYEMFDKYHLGYCIDALYEYRAAKDRIIIPLFMDEVLVGWQARYVGELDWKKTPIPKYYNLPGMKRRQILYNYDTARKEPYGVLLEGVTGVWNLGDKAVALLGKVLSGAQLELIIKTWKAVVILMDGDDTGKEAAQAIYDELRHYIPCVVVTLPPERDPGNSDAEWLWMLIHTKAASEGLDLESLTKEDQRDICDDNSTRSAGGRDSADAEGGDKEWGVGGSGSVSADSSHSPRYAPPRTKFYQTGGKHQW
jgi:hypothetical protein